MENFKQLLRRHRLAAVLTQESLAGETRLVGEFVAAMRPQPVILWGRCPPDQLGSYEPF